MKRDPKEKNPVESKVAVRWEYTEEYSPAFVKLMSLLLRSREDRSHMTSEDKETVDAD